MLLLKLSWEALFVEFTGVSMPLQYSRIALICQSFLVTFFAFAVLSYLPCFSLVHVLLDIPGLYLVLVINVTHIIPTEGSSLQ